MREKEKKTRPRSNLDDASREYLSSNHHQYYSSINQQSTRSYFPSFPSSFLSLSLSNQFIKPLCRYVHLSRNKQKKRRVLLRHISSTNYPHLPEVRPLTSSLTISYTYVLLSMSLDNQCDVEKILMSEENLLLTNQFNIRFLFLTANTGSIFEKVTE